MVPPFFFFFFPPQDSIGLFFCTRISWFHLSRYGCDPPLEELFPFGVGLGVYFPPRCNGYAFSFPLGILFTGMRSPGSKKIFLVFVGPSGRC